MFLIAWLLTLANAVNNFTFPLQRPLSKLERGYGLNPIQYEGIAESVNKATT